MRPVFARSLILSLLLSTPAWAAPAVDEAGAQKLAADITTYLAGKDYKTQGPVTVTPEGSSYAVTIPTGTLPLNGATGLVGAFALEVTPLDDGKLAYTGQIASPFIKIVNAAGGQVFAASAAAQRLEGVWNTEGHYADKTDFALSNITLADDTTESAGSVKSLTFTSNASPADGDKINGRAVFSMKDVEIVNPDKADEYFRVGGVGFTSVVKNVSVQYSAAGQDSLKALQRGTMDPGEMLERVLADQKSPFSLTSGEAEMAFVVSNVSVNTHNGPEGKPLQITLPQVRFGLTAGAQQPVAKNLTFLRLYYDHSGLKVTPVQDLLVAALLPTTTKIDVAVNNLPLIDLLKVASDRVNLATEGATPANPGSNVSAKNQTRDVLAKANTQVNISALNFAAPSLAGATSGKFTATAGAAHGFVGESNSRLVGLDELLAKLAASAQKASAGAQPQAMSNLQGALMGLSMLQGFGQQVPNANPSVRTYKVEVTPQGGIKLNGTDFGALAGALGAAGAKQPSP